jgi:transcriptional regulator with XRE-family HTH domain
VPEPRYKRRVNSAAFGGLLKNLRTVRRVSQLKLSLDAEVSTRHLSFLETGRANPSREMVLLLGSALELSLRDRNLLLEAAGFTPAYRETPLDAPEMAELRHALELILRAHEPLPTVADG